MSYTPYTTSPTEVLQQQSIMTRVYAWMMAGLLVTGAIAMFVASTSLGVALISNRLLFFGIIIGELALVWYLSARINKIAASTATGLFLAYAALNGVTLSIIFLAYTSSSIASTFFVTGATFGVMSVYGYTTKRDLSRLGSILFMALIGFLIASVVNLFLQSGVIYWITTYAGILIFVGLTAWDTQKIKQMSMHSSGEESQVQRIAILGALMLYLDFINLFLLLLRIMGNRR